MAVYQLKTFEDIYTAVLEELGIQTGDTTRVNRIKRIINEVYINEVVPAERWKWLRDTLEIPHAAKFNTGSVSVTQNDRTVTLSETPSSSYKGYWFSTSDFSERYRIDSHTSGSSTIQLESPYNGENNTAATFDIWSDFVPLPPEVRETIEITHDFINEPLYGKGLQEFRKLVHTAPRLETYPRYYSTGDWVDPEEYDTVSGLPATNTRASSQMVKTIDFASDVSNLLEAGDPIEVSGAGDDSYDGQYIVGSVTSSSVTYIGKEFKNESATSDATITVKKRGDEINSFRYRELLIHPAKFDKQVNLHIDVIREATPLEDDADEPIIPLEDRVVLKYGALRTAWRSIGRNPEEAGINEALFKNKLGAMRGKLDDSTDFPQLRPKRSYISSKRQLGRRRHPFAFSGIDGFTGGAGSTSVSGTADQVAIFNSSGNIASSPTISTTELNYLNGLTAAVVGISSTQTLTNKEIDADNNTISNIENDNIKSTAAIVFSKMAALTGSRVTVTDTSGVVTASSVSTTELEYLSGATAAVVTISGTQTLTNKTLTSPTITTGDFNGQQTFDSGSAAAPSIVRNGDTDTGFAWEANNQVSIATGGIRALEVDGGQDVYIRAGQLSLTDSASANLHFEQITTPSNASAGRNKLYFKSDDIIYTLDSAGTEIGLINESSTQTITNKTIDVDNNTVSNIENDNIKSTAAIVFSKMEALTGSRALETDTDGVITASSITATELGYLNGVTAAIQTQLDDKLNTYSGSTDNVIIRSDGTGGADIQESGISIDDSDNIAGIGTVSCGAITSSGDSTFNISNVFDIVSASDGANVTIESQQASVSETTGEVALKLQTKATDGGDPFISWIPRGSANWCMGVDSSVSTSDLLIGEGSRLSGGSHRIKIKSGGDLELLTGDLILSSHTTASADSTAPTHINLPTGGTAAQAGWLQVDINGTTSYLPFWQ